MKRIFRIPDVDAVGIYMIENVDTKKRYIGSSTNVKYRLKSHESIIRSGYGINGKMDDDIKAGHNKFFAVVLETFPDGKITNSQLSRIEREYISRFGSNGEYNYDHGPERFRFGRKDPLLYAHGTLKMLGMEKPRSKRESDEK